MFVQDRDSARRYFFDVWRKNKADEPMEPLETMISGVILQHPEYHAFLDDEDAGMTREFSPEAGMSNPFLHMGMHISIQEQLTTDRPQGIFALYQQLLPKFASPHELEHRMMDCLGEAMWAAQRDQVIPSETAYLECLRKLP